MVDTPSSSSSSTSSDDIGGRIVIICEVEAARGARVEELDLASIPATTALTLAPPVGPRSISISQSSSSSSSSLSECAWSGMPSGMSKSVSAQSSRGTRRVGGGAADIVVDG